jgi:hyperosmotically inducible periplasmic protein
MNHHPTHARLALITSVLLVSLISACKPSPQTTGEKVDEAILKTQQAASDVKSDIKQEAKEIKESTQDAAKSGASAISDTAVTTGIKARLATDKDLKATDIEVETHEGLVTLKGTAPNLAALGRAKDLAASVDGAHAVDNQLSVK